MTKQNGNVQKFGENAKGDTELSSHVVIFQKHTGAMTDEAFKDGVQKCVNTFKDIRPSGSPEMDIDIKVSGPFAVIGIPEGRAPRFFWIAIDNVSKQHHEEFFRGVNILLRERADAERLMKDADFTRNLLKGGYLDDLEFE